MNNNFLRAFIFPLANVSAVFSFTLALPSQHVFSATLPAGQCGTFSHPSGANRFLGVVLRSDGWDKERQKKEETHVGSNLV